MTFYMFGRNVRPDLEGRFMYKCGVNRTARLNKVKVELRLV